MLAESMKICKCSGKKKFLYAFATKADARRNERRIVIQYTKIRTAGNHIMKKLSLTIVLFLFATALFAQEETLFDSDHHIELGMYGAAGVRFTSIQGELGVLVGGCGALVLDHQLTIGAGGYGLVNGIRASAAAYDYYKPTRDLYLEMGYGGGIVEYTLWPNKIAHVNVGVLVGGGAVTYRYNNMDSDWNWMNDTYGLNTKTDVFFVVEPSLNAEVNVTTWMRACIGGSYRFVTGVGSLVDLQNSDLRGANVGLTFKFGKF
jgi:hypothetical protein